MISKFVIALTGDSGWKKKKWNEHTSYYDFGRCGDRSRKWSHDTVSKRKKGLLEKGIRWWSNQEECFVNDESEKEGESWTYLKRVVRWTCCTATDVNCIPSSMKEPFTPSANVFHVFHSFIHDWRGGKQFRVPIV